MTSRSDLGQDQRMLEELVKQLKKENPTLGWIDELDTTSVRSFKQCYAMGNWSVVSADQFLDMFGCGYESNFTFNEEECELLWNHFGICILPHEGAPERRTHAADDGRWYLVERKKRKRVRPMLSSNYMRK